MTAFVKLHQNFLLFIIVLTALLGIMIKDWVVLSKQDIWADEYVFLRVSSEIPKYESHKYWLDGHEEFEYLDPDGTNKIIASAYNHPVWVHPWLAPIIMWPVTKFILTDFIEQILIYRALYMLIVFITILLFVDVIRRKYGWIVGAMSLVPMIVSQNLLMAGAYVYVDAWMCLFFAVSVWLMNVKYESRWKYVTVVMMVLSKSYAAALVLPLMLMCKNWKDAIKIGVCGLSIVTYFVYQSMSKLPVYSTETMYNINKWNWTMIKEFGANIIDYVSGWGLFISVPLVIGGLIAWIKKIEVLHYSWIVMFFVMLALAINGGLSGYKTFPVLYGVMFVMIPLSVKIVSKLENIEKAGL